MPIPGGMETSGWRRWGRYAVAAGAAAAIAAFAFVLRRPVPVFDWVDLGVHELGHMLVPGPRMLHFLAGSAVQVLLPAGLAAYFFWRQRDPAGGGLCLAWAGASAWDVSVYIADAPVQALPLIGGGTHDWAYLLGPQGWDAVGSAATIARVVDVAGMAMALAGISAALWPAVRSFRGGRVPALQLPLDDPPAGAPVPASPPSAVVPAASDDPWLAAARLPFYADVPGDTRR